MIQINDSPTNLWCSAYDESGIMWAFYNQFDFNSSTYNITQSTTKPLYSLIECDNLTSLFSIGDCVTYPDPIDNKTYNVLGIEGNKIIIDSPWVAGTYNTTVFYLNKTGKQSFVLQIGFPSGHPLYSQLPLEDYATINLNANKNMEYVVNIAGYIQTYFKNLPPPILGSDKNLYIGFQLLSLEFGLRIPQETPRYCLNSCLTHDELQYYIANKPILTNELLRISGEGILKSFIMGKEAFNAVI